MPMDKSIPHRERVDNVSHNRLILYQIFLGERVFSNLGVASTISIKINVN